MIGKLKELLKKKKGMELEMLGWWIIGISVLVIMVIGYFILQGKGISAVEMIKNLFKFGR